MNMNDELVMILNEVECFKVISQIFPLRAERNFGQDIRPPGRELNPGSLRFRGVLSTQPRHSICPEYTFLVRKNGRLLWVPYSRKRLICGSLLWLSLSWIYRRFAEANIYGFHCNKLWHFWEENLGAWCKLVHYRALLLSKNVILKIHTKNTQNYRIACCVEWV